MFRKMGFNAVSRRRVSLVITALLILPFAIFFTANTKVAPPGPGGAAGRVFGDDVPWDTFQRQRAWLRQRWENQLGGTFPEQLQPVLDQQTWDMLILLREAKRRRITVGDQELAKVITQSPAFQDDGRFRPERYYRMLQAMNTSPQVFEELLSNDLLAQKLLAAVRAEVSASDDDARQAFHEANDRRRATLMLFESAGYARQASKAATDEAIRGYYDQHSGAFTIPERIEVEYAGASREALRAKLAPVDGEEPSEADQRLARQLAALAADLQDDVETGSRFEEIAQARALIVRTAGPVGTDGSDLGELPHAVFQAVVSLPAAQLSEVVKTDDGVYLARVTRRLPAELRPFDSVKSEARQRLVDERAQQAARDAAFGYSDALRSLLQQGWRFEEAVLRAGAAPAVRSVTFTRDGPMPTIGGVPPLNQTGFATALGELSQVVELPNGYALIRPEEHLAADAAAFQAEAATWRTQATERKQSAYLEAWMATVRERANLQSFLGAADAPDGQTG